MLRSFTLDPAALNVEVNDPILSQSIIKTLGHYWLSCGVLMDLEPDARFFADAIRNLEPAIKKYWMTLFGEAKKRCRIVGSPTTLSDMFTGQPADSLTRLAPLVDIFCVPKESPAKYALLDGKPSVIDPATGLEVCRIDCVPNSIRFGGLDEKLKGILAKGMDPKFIFREYFEPFLTLHPKMVIVDCYCAIRNRKAVGSGLEVLLKSINSVRGRDRYVTIYSGVPDGESSSALIASLRAMLKRIGPGAIAELDVYLTDERIFKQHAHYRYVKFGVDYCLFLDSGIEVLEGQTVKRACPYYYNQPDKECNANEAYLRQSAVKQSFCRGNGLAQNLPIATAASRGN